MLHPPPRRPSDTDLGPQSWGATLTGYAVPSSRSTCFSKVGVVVPIVVGRSLSSQAELAPFNGDADLLQALGVPRAHCPAQLPSLAGGRARSAPLLAPWRAGAANRWQHIAHISVVLELPPATTSRCAPVGPAGWPPEVCGKNAARSQRNASRRGRGTRAVLCPVSPRRGQGRRRSTRTTCNHRVRGGVLCWQMRRNLKTLGPPHLPRCRRWPASSAEAAWRKARPLRALACGARSR